MAAGVLKSILDERQLREGVRPERPFVHWKDFNTTVQQSLRKLSEAGRVTTAGSFASALRKAEFNPLMQDSES